MGEVVLFGAGTIVFAITTTATLLFGYSRMQEAYDAEDPVEDGGTVSVDVREDGSGSPDLVDLEDAQAPRSQLG